MASYKCDNDQFEQEIGLLRTKLEDKLEKLSLANEEKEDLMLMKSELKTRIDHLQNEKSKLNEEMASVKLRLEGKVNDLEIENTKFGREKRALKIQLAE